MLPVVTYGTWIKWDNWHSYTLKVCSSLSLPFTCLCPWPIFSWFIHAPLRYAMPALGLTACMYLHGLFKNTHGFSSLQFHQKPNVSFPLCSRLLLWKTPSGSRPLTLARPLAPTFPSLLNNKMDWSEEGHVSRGFLNELSLSKCPVCGVVVSPGGDFAHILFY